MLAHGDGKTIQRFRRWMVGTFITRQAMDNSLESLGQQWGRAGRRSQQSQCYLIFSDDHPDTTDKWLNGEIAKMPRRFDDLGTISFFHSQSFPGEEVDIKGTLKVISQLYHAEKDADGRRSIKEGTNKRCQQYLSFLIMMGLVEDFEVTGMHSTTQYHARLHPVAEEGVLLNDENKIRDHLVMSLQDYPTRARKISLSHDSIVIPVAILGTRDKNQKTRNYLKLRV